MCEVKRFAGIGIFSCSRRTFVKGHHYVSTDRALYVHHLLRGEQMFRAVDMRTEPCSLLSQLTVGGERKHLETSAVGKDRLLPSVELMKPTDLLENLYSWTKIEMIGVSKDNLGLDVVAQFMLMHGFYTTECAHRHENRSAYLSVVGSDKAGTRGSVGSCCF